MEKTINSDFVSKQGPTSDNEFGSLLSIDSLSCLKELPLIDSSRKKIAPFSINNHLLMKEADRRGWKSKILDYEKDLITLFPESNDPHKMILLQRCRSELNTALGLVLANDKMLTHIIADIFDVPMPASLIYMPNRPDFYQELTKFLQRHSQVVVKPTDCSSGDGVTTNVTNVQLLKSSLIHAGRYSSNLVIQEYVPGNDYRILVLNGHTIAAAWRRPPYVIGDGIKSVRQLIELKNTHPWRGIQQDKPLKVIDLKEVEAYIGIDRLESVPMFGCEVQVIGVASISRGGESRDVTHLLHPTIRCLAETISNAAQLGLCGVDMMIDGDITKPIGPECRATLIEINVSPGLRMHHFPSDGGFPRNVTGAILDEIIRRRLIYERPRSIHILQTKKSSVDDSTFFAPVLSDPEVFTPLSETEKEYYSKHEI